MGSSEVARLRQEIDSICAGMYRGLYGYAIVATHEVITSKYNQLGQAQKELALHVGKEPALQEVFVALQRAAN